MVSFWKKDVKLQDKNKESDVTRSIFICGQFFGKEMSDGDIGRKHHPL